ncbi:hypothetical protein PTTG_12144 [Puccinia triticina 1-1 BBBD Race 1]|uniref:Uncharacterized protein n=1 Tax=Puccinia triticina (isolate 1-1 / race 1 (BBBD)) TaxID=630390 RepID=A0A180GSX7_PUCT1|nr:hypothetical protein PTTG_12144 [Puccinia triticina 1-1 BBBD Race 1]
MVKHVILYTRVLFKEHGLGNIFGGVRYFTEHYKWTSLDPSFKCIGKTEKRIIDLTFLAQKLDYFCCDFITSCSPTEYSDFKIHLKINKYVNKLKFSSNSEELLDHKKKITNHQLIPEYQEYKGDLERLITLLLKALYKRELPLFCEGKRDISLAICEFFDFIEKEFCPGLVKITVSEYFKNDYKEVERFEEQVQLILLQEEFYEIKNMTYDLWSLESDEVKLLLEDPNIHQTFYQEIPKRFQEFFPKFKDMYLRIDKRGDSLSNWLRNQNEIPLFFDQIEKLRGNFMQMYKSIFGIELKTV